MTTGAGSLDHLHQLCQLLEELATNGVSLESHEYHASAIGGFVVVLARGQAKAKFIWDGKDSILTVEYLNSGSSEAAASWVHDAYIEVPERRAVFSEIASNAVSMLDQLGHTMLVVPYPRMSPLQPGAVKPNPSIERTFQRPLRALWPAAHVKRQAPLMQLSLSFELTGLGWAKCEIADSDASCFVTASYLSDALGSLVIAATAVQAGFSRVAFSFEEEPGEYRWIITSPRTNEIELSIIQFESVYNELPDERGETLFFTRCRPVVFAEAVSRAASRLLSQLGEAGYNEKWSEHLFPSQQLAELDRLLEGRRDA